MSRQRVNLIFHRMGILEQLAEGGYRTDHLDSEWEFHAHVPSGLPVLLVVWTIQAQLTGRPYRTMNGSVPYITTECTSGIKTFWLWIKCCWIVRGGRVFYSAWVRKTQPCFIQNLKGLGLGSNPDSHQLKITLKFTLEKRSSYIKCLAFPATTYIVTTGTHLTFTLEMLRTNPNTSFTFYELRDIFRMDATLAANFVTLKYTAPKTCYLSLWLDHLRRGTSVAQNEFTARADNYHILNAINPTSFPNWAYLPNASRHSYNTNIMYLHD